MQRGQGRGGRQVHVALGGGSSNQTHGTRVTYGGMPGYPFNSWLGYTSYNVHTVMPVAPPVPRTYHRGSASRPVGFLKRPSGPAQRRFLHGRSHFRGHSGLGRRDKNLSKLTMEALNVDLDEWRMKDKDLGCQYFDADLDEYWKKDEVEAGVKGEGCGKYLSQRRGT